MGKDKRIIRLEATFNNEEYGKLKERIGQTNIKTMSNYLRTMALKGYIINLDLKEILEPVRLMRSISSNINQISAIVNSTDSIYAEDISELNEKYKELSKSIAEIIGYISRLEES